MRGQRLFLPLFLLLILFLRIPFLPLLFLSLLLFPLLPLPLLSFSPPSSPSSFPPSFSSSPPSSSPAPFSPTSFHYPSSTPSSTPSPPPSSLYTTKDLYSIVRTCTCTYAFMTGLLTCLWQYKLCVCTISYSNCYWKYFLMSCCLYLHLSLHDKYAASWMYLRHYPPPPPLRPINNGKNVTFVLSINSN